MGFRQFLLIVWARRLMVLVPFLVTIAATTAIVFILPPRYEATATLLLQNGQPDPVTGDQMNVQAQHADTKTALALLGSNLIAIDVVRQLNLTAISSYQNAFQSRAASQGSLEQFIASQLLTHMQARTVVAMGDETNEISVTFSSPSAAFSAAVANAFVDSFLKRNLEFKTEPALRDAQWYAERNSDMLHQLQNARAKFLAFQQQHGLLGRGDEVDAETARLKTMSDQITDLRRDLTSVQSVLSQVDAAWPKGTAAPIDAPPVGLSNDTLSKLQQSLADAEVAVAQQAGALGPNNEHFKELVASQNALRRQIEANLVNSRIALEGRLAGLKQQETLLDTAYQAQTQKVLQEQGLRNQLDTLAKEVDQQQTQYDGATGRAAALKLEGERSSMNITPIDTAYPPEAPVFPKKVLTIAASVILGAMLGLMLALLREAFDRRVRVASDLETMIDAPLLGVLLPSASRKPA